MKEWASYHPDKYIKTNYIIASRTAQSLSVYLIVCQNPMTYAYEMDEVNLIRILLRNKFFFVGWYFKIIHLYYFETEAKKLEVTLIN